MRYDNLLGRHCVACHFFYDGTAKVRPFGILTWREAGVAIRLYIEQGYRVSKPARRYFSERHITFLYKEMPSEAPL